MIREREQEVARVGMHTPWGTADYAGEIVAGMGTVGTPSHGGIKLSRERNRRVPEYMRQKGGWYEEDCDWCIPFVVFEQEILAAGDACAARAITTGQHKETLKAWHPEAYETFYGVTLQAGESFKRDEELFAAKHAHDYVVVSAYGDWHKQVPSGMVGVLATLGGTRVPGSFAQGRWFLVPAAEYEERSLHGFVIDVARHAQTEAIR